MPLTLTVTGTAGPGGTVTAAAFTGVTLLTIDPDANIITFVDSARQTRQVAVVSATTVTATKSGTSWALTIS